MSKIEVCKVCGKPLAEHTLIFRQGVAHAAVHRENRLVSCSELQGEADYIRGRLHYMQSTIRSLRWHAGRMQTKDHVWAANDLRKQANKISGEALKLGRMLVTYFPWK